MNLTQISIQKAPDGKFQDGRGLILVKKGKTGKWVYRYSHLGKRREMGLGSWPTVKLADARKLRDQWATVLSSGKDPIVVRDADKQNQKAEADRHDPTFAELTDMVFEAKKASLRGDGKRGRWRSPVDLYMIPAFGKKPGSQLTQRDIVDALRPIWKGKFPTADKAIQRTRIILKSSKRMGFATNPDIVEAAQEVLGTVHHEVQHTPYVLWQDIPAIYQWLEGRGASAVCLQFKILTMVRVSGCRSARFDEINSDVWTVPKARIKARQGKAEDFRVPLSMEAQKIIEHQRNFGGDFIFPGYRGKPLSDTAMSKMMKDNGIEGKPHGFRTTFRTWVQDNETTSREVAETILGHITGGKTERAYARSDLFDLRRPVMQAWASYVTGKTGPKGEDISA